MTPYVAVRSSHLLERFTISWRFSTRDTPLSICLIKENCDLYCNYTRRTLLTVSAMVSILSNKLKSSVKTTYDFRLTQPLMVSTIQFLAHRISNNPSYGFQALSKDAAQWGRLEVASSSNLSW